MKTYLVKSTTSVMTDPAEVKQHVIEGNLKILRGAWPSNPFLSAKDMIGDPNAYLSEDICELLHDKNVLTRIPVCGPDDKQLKLMDGSLLWDYFWAEEADVLSLLPEDLEKLALDLGAHPHFMHVSVVGDEPEESEEESLDSADDAEYDDSTDNEAAH